MKIAQKVVGVGNNNRNIKTKIMVLKKGSTGPEVEELQKALGIPVDGDFGPQTEAAVKRISKTKWFSCRWYSGTQYLCKINE